ncbi:MAG: zinc-ribbon domain-containing protein [Candidatus Thorarchaeota archaeon]|nr:zinc-ribbon domain-containing protein [Candidatus Thorarchaeota archaeon]
MQTCPNCGKANQPTRKYCIRCGASLLKPIKEAAPAPPKPKIEVPELGRVTTGASVKAQKEAAAGAAAAAAAEPPPPTTDDRWVRPSEVPRDRVRIASTTRGKSESEKAKEIFAKAMEYGIEESGSGVVESRMLRASEVRMLMESGSEQEPEPTPSPAVRPRPSSTTAATTPAEERQLSPSDQTRPVEEAVPASARAEERILGSRSSFVRPGATAEEDLIAEESSPAAVDSAILGEFRSSRYSDEGADEAHVPTPAIESDMDLVSTCPKCGAVISKDMFEYAPEIYSAMGDARLKEARFMVVQGKYDEAQRIIRIAKALFSKSGDDSGLSMVQKLVDSLARG